MSIDNAQIDPYFTVNLEGDEEIKAETDSNRRAWRDVKSLLRNSFSATNRIDLTDIIEDPLVKNEVVEITTSEDHSSADADIFNTMGMNLEKKFRFNSIFKVADATDDITAMIQAATETDSAVSAVSSRFATSSFSDFVDTSVTKHEVLQIDNMSAVLGAGTEDVVFTSRTGSRANSFTSSSGEKRRGRGIWTGGEGLSTNKLAMMLSDMQDRLNDVDSVYDNEIRTQSENSGKLADRGSARVHESDDLLSMLRIGSPSNFVAQLTSELNNDNASAAVVPTSIAVEVDASESVSKAAALAEEQHVSPNTEVKTVPIVSAASRKGGGRIAKPSGEGSSISGDETASVVSSLSASSAGARSTTARGPPSSSSGTTSRTPSRDRSTLTAANIARSTGTTTTATVTSSRGASTSRTRANLPSSAAPTQQPLGSNSRAKDPALSISTPITGSRQRSTTPTSLPVSKPSTRTVASRSTTPSGTSSRALPSTSSAAASSTSGSVSHTVRQAAPAAAILRKSLDSAATSSRTPVSASTTRRSLDTASVASTGSTQRSTTSRSTTPNATSSRASTLHTPTAASTASKFTASSASASTPQRPTTPNSTGRSSFGLSSSSSSATNRPTTPTSTSRSMTPTAVPRNTSGLASSVSRSSTPTSLAKSTIASSRSAPPPVDAKAPVDHRASAGSSVSTPTSNASRIASRTGANSSSSASMAVSTSRDNLSVKRASMPPASNSATKAAPPGRASTGGVSAPRTTGTIKPTVTPGSTMASRAAARTAAAAESQSAKKIPGTRPQAATSPGNTTTRSSSLTRATTSSTVTASTPSTIGSKSPGNQPSTPTGLPQSSQPAVYKTPQSVLSHTRSSSNNMSSSNVLLRKNSTMDIKESGGVSISLDTHFEGGLDSSSGPVSTNSTGHVSYNYQALQQMALQSPSFPSSSPVTSMNTAVYMPSLRHSSQTVINAMYNSVNATAASASNSKTSSFISNNTHIASPEKQQQQQSPLAFKKKISASDFAEENPMLQQQQQQEVKEKDSEEHDPEKVTLQLTRKPGSRRPSLADALIGVGDTALGSPNEGTPRPSILKTSSSIGMSGRSRSSSFKADAKLKVTIAEPGPQPATSDFSSSRPLLNGRTYQSLAEVNSITAALKELSKHTSLANLKEGSSAPVPPSPRTISRSNSGASINGTPSPRTKYGSGAKRFDRTPSSDSLNGKRSSSSTPTPLSEPVSNSAEGGHETEDEVVTAILSNDDLAAALL